jgi:hypothetical protein
MDQGLMSHHRDAPSAATSPGNQHFPADLFPLDFLSFAESTSPSILGNLPDFSLPSPPAIDQAQHSNPHHQQQQQSFQSPPIFDNLRNGAGYSPADGTPPSRGGSSKGRARSKAPKKAGGASGKRGQRSAQTGTSGMEVDQEPGAGDASGGGADGSKAPMSQEEMAMRLAQIYAMQGDGPETLDGYGQFTSLSQGMLQQVS